MDRFWTRGANCIWVNKIALKKIAVSDFPRNFFLAEKFPSKNRLCAIFLLPLGIVPCVIRRPGWPLFIDKMHFVKSEYTKKNHIMYLVCIIYALYVQIILQVDQSTQILYILHILWLYHDNSTLLSTATISTATGGITAVTVAVFFCYRDHCRLCGCRLPVVMVSLD